MLMIYPLMLGTWEIVAIVLVILLLFGGKKIPELMRGLGKGVKEYKNAVNSVDDDEQKGKDSSSSSTPSDNTDNTQK